ncbi:hypothetical protein ACFYVC_23760 [Streptomyces tendae]|uniref:hypothetical protein n=1 Tax=Streptomyces tendae TaxID=1932 RepID=UPI0036AF2FFB
MDRHATGQALVEQLPPPLPADRITALNQPKADLHTTRSYEWNGWTFDVPPGVFVPGWTSRLIRCWRSSSPRSRRKTCWPPAARSTSSGGRR